MKMNLKGIFLTVIMMSTSLCAHAVGPYYGKVTAITTTNSAAYVSFSTHHACGHSDEFQILKTLPNFNELFAALLMAKSEDAETKLVVSSGCHDGGYRQVQSATIF